jgi:hypothetical protein
MYSVHRVLEGRFRISRVEKIKRTHSINNLDN